MICEIVKQPDDSSHDRMVWICQSDTDRDKYMRCFPNPIPDTHELVYEWDATGMRLTLAVRPRDEAAIAGRAARAGRGLARVVNDARKELDKLKRDELMTRAAELGLGDKISGSATKAEIVSQILRRMDEEGLLGGEGDDDDEDGE